MAEGTDIFGALGKVASRIGSLEDQNADLIDQVDGLIEDLKSAVEVAYKHGAEEWVRLNYPAEYLTLREKYGWSHEGG